MAQRMARFSIACLVAGSLPASVAGCAHRAAGPARVTGRVVDERGAPVVGVEVVQTVTGWSRRSATTDMHGVFVLPPLPLTPDGQRVIPDHPMDPMEAAPLVVQPARDARLVVIHAGVELQRFGPDATTACTVGLAFYRGGVAVAARVVNIPLDEGAIRLDDVRLVGDRLAR